MPKFDPTKYYTTYIISNHPEGLTKEKVKALTAEDNTVGATHDLIVGSVIHTSSGGLSTLVMSMGVDGEELSPEELFKFWSMMGHDLTKRLDPEGWQYAIAEMAFEAMRRIVLSTRDEVQEEN